ncbi:MAG: hypothetical protein WDN66_05120 [Candidatus Saccharibacteria bacterium]
MPKKTQAKKATPKKKSTKATKSSKVQIVEQVKLSNVLRIAAGSWLIIWRNRKAFSLIILIYGFAYLILVLGLSSPASANGFNAEFSNITHGHLSSFYSGYSVFTFLVGSTASSGTAEGGAYQAFIVVIASLSIIWALRQLYSGTKIRVRDAYYLGMYPLIKYILIILFMLIELIPLAVGLGLYSLLFGNSVAATAIEKLISLVIVLGLVGLSAYLITSSTIALYIVTLPDMTPMKALRSAKSLVKGRRWSVFRKIIFLPVLLFIVAGIVILPFILVVPALSPWLFFIITLVGLVYVHSYLYSLYRGLIDDQSTS